MTPFDSTRYAPLIAELLREPWVPPLDAGRPNPAMRERLDASLGADAFAPLHVHDRALAERAKGKLLTTKT